MGQIVRLRGSGPVAGNWQVPTADDEAPTQEEVHKAMRVLERDDAHGGDTFYRAMRKILYFRKLARLAKWQQYTNWTLKSGMTKTKTTIRKWCMAPSKSSFTIVASVT